MPLEGGEGNRQPWGRLKGSAPFGSHKFLNFGQNRMADGTEGTVCKTGSPRKKVWQQQGIPIPAVCKTKCETGLKALAEGIARVANPAL